MAVHQHLGERPGRDGLITRTNNMHTVVHLHEAQAEVAVLPRQEQDGLLAVRGADHHLAVDLLDGGAVEGFAAQRGGEVIWMPCVTPPPCPDMMLD